LKLLSKQERLQISEGNIKLLKEYLNSALEDCKDQLLCYKKDNTGFDNVLKGRGIFIKEMLDLLNADNQR